MKRGEVARLFFFLSVQILPVSSFWLNSRVKCRHISSQFSCTVSSYFGCNLMYSVAMLKFVVLSGVAASAIFVFFKIAGFLVLRFNV